MNNNHMTCVIKNYCPNLTFYKQSSGVAELIEFAATSDKYALISLLAVFRRWVVLLLSVNPREMMIP